MTIDEAISNVTQLTYQGYGPPDTETKDALKLLIEAGKRIETARMGGVLEYINPLPGETE